MKRQTKSLFLELKSLSSRGTEALYEAIGVARRIMEDKTWWDGLHADEFAALDALSDEYFAQLHGYVTLSELIRAHAAFTESVWRENRYHVRVMIDMLRERTAAESGDETEPVKRTRVSKAMYDQLLEERDDLAAKLRHLQEENERLHERIAELRTECARLQGMIHALQHRGELVSA